MSDQFDQPAPFSFPVILFAIGLGLTVIGVLCELKLCYDFMKTPTFELTTNPGFFSPYCIPMMEQLMYLNLIVKGVVLLAVLGLLFLLADKSVLFIKWVRVYLIAGVFIEIAETVAVLYLRAAMAEKHLLQLFEIDSHLVLVLAAVPPLITLVWLGYFSTSKRVQRIFIN